MDELFGDDLTPESHLVQQENESGKAEVEVMRKELDVGFGMRS